MQIWLNVILSKNNKTHFKIIKWFTLVFKTIDKIKFVYIKIPLYIFNHN